LDKDGPSNTGQMAQPSLYSTPWTTIFLPVGTADDAPQNANDPLCSFTILSDLMSSRVSVFVLQPINIVVVTINNNNFFIGFILNINIIHKKENPSVEGRVLMYSSLFF
jgi:hypothetical protein